MGFQSLNDVLQEQLEDLHSAETQLVTALPKDGAVCTPRRASAGI
jgi:ferritin-like metal-binding protein YciE